MSADAPEDVVVEVVSSEDDEIGPECPIEGCGELAFGYHEMLDHLEDHHELSDKLLRGTVIINE